jgi:hypothetical protein
MTVSLPFTSLARQVLMALMNAGRGDPDHSAIATFIEDMAKTEVRGPWRPEIGNQDSGLGIQGHAASHAPDSRFLIPRRGGHP